jgi:hypothetical protein
MVPYIIQLHSYGADDDNFNRICTAACQKTDYNLFQNIFCVAVCGYAVNNMDLSLSCINTVRSKS